MILQASLEDMEAARKKIVKHIASINNSNEKVIRGKLKDVFSLKKQKLSNIDSRNVFSSYRILLHKDTHNYPPCTKYVLSLMTALKQEYAYVELFFEDESDWNAVAMHLYWEEYLRELSGTTSSWGDLMAKQDYSGVHDLLRTTNDKNEGKMKEKLQVLLKKPKTSMVALNDQVAVLLCKNTFHNHFTRMNFQQYAAELQDKYPFIEIFHRNGRTAVIRVWWKLYFQPESPEELTQRPVKKRKFRRKKYDRLVQSSYALSSTAPTKGATPGNFAYPVV